MTTLEIQQNVSRIKEVMGSAFQDHTIIQALMVHQNNFERALNHLLEGDPPITTNSPAEGNVRSHNHLRQSITDAFMGTTHTSADSPNPSSLGATQDIRWIQSSQSATRPDHNWSAPPADSLLSTSNRVTELKASEAREPELLPNSPPKASYQPVTVTGQTTPTEDFRLSEVKHQKQRQHANRPGYSIDDPSRSEFEPPPPDLLVIDENPDKRYEAELNAAIQASLAPESNQNKSSLTNTAGPRSLKDLTTEDEQMSKALEESLAMSSSRTLEADSKFSHPPPQKRARPSSTPVALRVQNPHIVFLPCLLSAMYAAKPFRDRVLSLQPLSTSQIEPLIEHGVEGMWNGKSSWRSGENWPEKPQSIEIIIAIQRLFAMMTHTKRSYLDVQELSLLLGYEEGEMISWSLNEPNVGCHRTYEAIAEAWRDYCWCLYKQADSEGKDAKLKQVYEDERRLFHWRGHKLSLPLKEEENISQPSLNNDNSTTSLKLNVIGSTLNDIYSCVDAVIWLPESNTAHFLDGTASVLAFEIDRRANNNHSNDWSSSIGLGIGMGSGTDLKKSPFKLEPEFWVDRYLLQKRDRVVELREEISRIEGEAEVSLARRDQLTQSAGKDLVSTLKATKEYLSTSTQFPLITSTEEREKKKKEMGVKFQKALEKLENELSSLDSKAKDALNAAKSIFDINEMKEFGPHELSSVVVSDGFSGREHMWTYIKIEDGRWFKCLDHTTVEVSLDTVLNDPAGLHMNSGHIFAVYVQKPNKDSIETESNAIPLRPSLENAIKIDNELLEREILESEVLDNQNYGDVVMEETGSPRSDVAEAGGGVPELELSSPLRLSGGAITKLDQEAEEEDDDSMDEDEDLVELGFLRKTKEPLDIRTMSGKVGGLPIWLDPCSPLDETRLKCERCGESMAFLLQMNAPEDSNPDAYYRTIYIFICRKMKCLRSNREDEEANKIGLKVFRYQLDETNELNDDKNRMKRLKDSSEFLTFLEPVFDEWEIICDGEPREDEVGNFQELSEGFCRLNKLGLNTKDERLEERDEDEDIKDTKVSVDESFLKFQIRIGRAPDQVLRYLRVSTPSIEPIAINNKKYEDFEKKCGGCGNEIRAEIQILSTLISFLGIKDLTKQDLSKNIKHNNEEKEEGEEEEEEEEEEMFDFGCLIVFSCLKSCGLKSKWKEEICKIEMFSNDGIQL